MSDWREVTAAERELMRSCGPGEVAIFYGDELVKITSERMLQIYRDAVNAAIKGAAEMLALERADEIESWNVDDFEMGQTFVRVTLTSKAGAQASAIGMIADPRRTH